MARAYGRRQTRRTRLPKRRFPTRHLLLLTLMALLTVTGSSATQAPEPVQIPLADAGEPHRTSRVLIDGRSNPELINRETLVAQILATMAIPTMPTEKEERRLQAFARVLDLGRSDEQILRVELTRLYTAMQPIRQRLEASRDTKGAPIADLAEFREVRLAAYGRLTQQLSANGRTKLDQFIEAQRRNAKVHARRPPV